jgi:signal transduction histidine kinase
VSPAEPIPEASRAIRLGILCGIAAALGLLAFERTYARRVEDAAEAQSRYVNGLAQMSGTVRDAHAAMLERWLGPLSERGAREPAIFARVEEVRKASASFANLPALLPEEPAVRQRVLVSVAAWSNRVQQAIAAADGPEYAAELRQYVGAISADSERIGSLAGSAGHAAKTQAGRLRYLQSVLQASLLGITAALAGLTIVGSRQRRRVEIRWRLAEAARAEQERLTHLRSQFFTNMSHELRTPLVSIRGVADELAEKTGDVFVQDAALRIAREAQELLGTINNILDAAKLETGTVPISIEDVSLAEVLGRCARRCEPLIGGRPVEIAVSVPEDTPRVRADFVKLQQVFTNLIANAVKFTPEGRVDVRARREGEQVVVEVADTGVGIPAEAIERIWQPFEQADGGTERRFGGTGLGLSIVKSLVGLMRSEVAVESTEGQGTTFRVTLPAVIGG